MTCRYVHTVACSKRSLNPSTHFRVFKPQNFLEVCPKTPLTQSVLWAPLLVPITLSPSNPLGGPTYTICNSFLCVGRLIQVWYYMQLEAVIIRVIIVQVLKLGAICQQCTYCSYVQISSSKLCLVATYNDLLTDCLGQVSTDTHWHFSLISSRFNLGMRPL